MKTLLVLLALLMGLLGCAGIPLSKDECNATLFPTAHEHEACLKAAADYEQAEHEREDKRLIRRDKFIIFLNACTSDDRLVLIEKKYASRSCLPNTREQRKAEREWGYRYTHDNVCQRGRQSDFACMYRKDFEDWLRRNLGY